MTDMVEIPFTRAQEMRDEIATLRRLLADLVDDSECRFDHNGACQEHGFLWLESGERCPNGEALDLLTQEDQS